MNATFQTCLLIDDNPLDNYINTLMIQKNNFASEVIALESSEDALLKLMSGVITPDVIFLDINMPVLNGFEFLAKYASLDINKEGTKIFVLSSSLNPADLYRAIHTPYVTNFIEKTLSIEKLQLITNSCRITPGSKQVPVEPILTRRTA